MGNNREIIVFGCDTCPFNHYKELHPGESHVCWIEDREIEFTSIEQTQPCWCPLIIEDIIVK